MNPVMRTALGILLGLAFLVVAWWLNGWQPVSTGIGFVLGILGVLTVVVLEDRTLAS